MSQIIKTYSVIPPVDVPIDFYTDDGNYAVAQANRLNVYTPGNGSMGIATSSQGPGTGNTITISVLTDAFAWVETSSDVSPAIVETGYFCNASLTVTLPTLDLMIGDTVIVYVDTPGTVVIQAGGSQLIQVGVEVSGVGGTATNSNKGDILELVYKPSDLTWHSIQVTGTWSVN